MLYAKQKKRHRCTEQTFRLCGRRREWDVLREQHWNKYTVKGEADHQPRLDACPSHHRGLKCKSRKSRDTWSNRQIWPWNTEWSRAKANRLLPRECTSHSKHPLPTAQEKTLHMDITRWSILKSDWLYSLKPKMEKHHTFSKNRTENWLWLRSWASFCQIQN